MQTASGYDVAWKLTGVDKYTVWATDSNGNYLSNLIGGVTGTSAALELFEPIFDQNLNGTADLTTTVIQTDTGSFGSTSLTEFGNAVSSVYYLDGSGGAGPALQYDGADVTAGSQGAWTPIGAVQTASGYDVAWKLTGVDKYTVWATDSHGNYLSNLIGGVTATSAAWESYETVFNQDLNGDGTIGIYVAPGAALQIATPMAGSSGTTTIGSDATLEIAAADSGPVTFAASTGMLKLDTPSTFSSTIFAFTGNGTLSGSDQIDLTNVNFNSVHDSYANGVLTVTDGTNTDELHFNGSYVLGNFKFASDGSGGTIVYDPPAPASDTPKATATWNPIADEQICNSMGRFPGFGAEDVFEGAGRDFDATTTLGYWRNSGQIGGTLSSADASQCALLRSYMASSLVAPSNGHGGVTMPSDPQLGSQWTLANPHHE